MKTLTKLSGAIPGLSNKVKAFLTLFVVSLYCSTASAEVTPETVTITDVIDMPGLMTEYITKAGSIVGLVIGAIFSFVLIWKAVRWIRRVG